ncbi:MAG TPA: anaerobic ribonucleoside-triphosphate reductase activating protein [Kiritimatiellia bacterium]|jgi:pyruvate formate lyase activating enzyme|nr:anaerobic ribonucleoside-triphosphate reductase activating protein [Kiritimatiellia bacterium]HOR98776.1 anaerobic ribonucleoside-triphosphate reductase activating protein [Kiritimatiellia bacterium]HPW75944.1 anaerobic ribonucleoside-triphosphate reductase activating protein [Kiritimatiellia bacterium]HRU20317.1 anaerobic ribonucleoside-triphosphate reductase activating protein [Kiritimatiellia bacterium]
MNIAGVVPLSLCDYPGRVAAVVFTQGCNFRCPFCHNAHLIPLLPVAGQMLEEEQVFARITEYRTRLDGVVVSGGEPTLQQDLPEFLLRLKTLGLAVKLDTNGSQPEMLRRVLDERLVDFIAMDVKAPWEHYPRLTGTACAQDDLLRSLRLIAGSGLPHQFRTTRVDPLLTDSDYRNVRAQIPDGSPHVWQAFRPEHAFDPALRPPRPCTDNVPVSVSSRLSDCPQARERAQ